MRCHRTSWKIIFYELEKEKGKKERKGIANINITESYKFQKHLLFTRQLNPSFKTVKEPKPHGFSISLRAQLHREVASEPYVTKPQLLCSNCLHLQ